MNAIRILFSLFISLVLAMPAAFAESSLPLSCKRIFSDKSFEAPRYEVRTGVYKGLEYSYKQVPRPEVRSHYHDVASMPEVKDAVVIHMDTSGHVSVWHKGVLIEGNGTPIYEIRGSTRKLNTLSSGVAFLLKDLPPDFTDQFSEFMDNFKSKAALTCVSHGCGILRDLGFEKQIPKNFVTPSGFLKHMFKMSTIPEMKIETYALGVDMDRFPTLVKENQAGFAQGVILTGAAIGMIPAVGVMYLIFR